MKTNKLRGRRAQALGVSLIEALVALAVMAFGMLGVVGIQTTLRSNADLSRQRAEAVRIAQEEIERIRSFSALRAVDAPPGRSFDAIDSVTAAEVPASSANTAFTRETLVATPTADDPLVRHVRVTVVWKDRRDQDQRVELSTVIAGFPPDLSALHAMRTDRGPLQQPLGRNPSIPRGAIDREDGTSRFVPPGGSPDRSWIFNNSTGLITQICDDDTCTDSSRVLLAGIVAFATGGLPTSAEAATPGDQAFSIGMRVDLLLPAVDDEVCATELALTRVTYYCAVPVDEEGIWFGQILFSGFDIAPSLASNSASLYKVCRYTPDDRNLRAVPTNESADFYNSRNPFFYVRSSQPQVNKNFLIISAGNGSTAFSCPDEDTATQIETNTWPHDPRPS